MLLEELQIFFLKGSRAMVFLLVTDVRPDRFDIRLAHAERAITLLPRKLRSSQFLVNPPGGVSFQAAHHVGHGVGGFQSDQKMDVIGDASNVERGSTDATNDATEVCMDARTNIGVDRWKPFFGAENEVVMKAGMRGGHRTP